MHEERNIVKLIHQITAEGGQQKSKDMQCVYNKFSVLRKVVEWLDTGCLVQSLTSIIQSKAEQQQPQG